MRRPAGFTLLEVMLVLLLMGLATGYVMLNAFGASQGEKLEEQARRFQVVFDMAADFAVLNQQQLGLRLEEKDNEYSFMILDDEDRWQRLEGLPGLEAHTLPEPFALQLTLDDLPWQEDDSLFDSGVFDEELSVSDEGVDIGNEEEKLIPPPQIMIMSSGDITPFSMAFIYEPNFGGDEPVYFQVNGEDTPPLKRVGPLERL